MQGLATSPLMLSIMSLAYQNSSPNDIIQGGTVEDYRQRLFDTYIDRMFERRSTTQQYSRQETRHWLIWLAQRLTDTAQTVFLIERLQPSWLPTRRQRSRFRLESSLLGVVFSGLVGGLAWGLAWGLIGELFGTAWEDGIAWEEFIGCILVGGLVGGLVGLTFALMASFFEDIQPVETLRWSRKVAWQSTKLGSLLGLILGVIFMLILMLKEKPSDDPLRNLFAMVTGGLIGGVMGGVTGGLIGGFRGSEIQQKGKPNQGIYRSAQSAIILGLSFGLSIGLSVWLIVSQSNGQGDEYLSELAADLIIGLIVGLIIGLMAVLIGGGSACIRHIALRLTLYRYGYSPRNYARFLDYAAERLFLQKVGGGYIFVHRMLLEHFAAMPLGQKIR